MTDGQPAAGGETDDAEAEGPNWGRVLDVAGVAAGLVLAVIVVDIWTDGRLISRRLGGRGGQADDGADETGDDHERPGGE